MNNSRKKSGSTRKDKEKIRKMIKSRLSKRERVFLTVCDLLIVAIVLIDLIFFMGLTKISNMMMLALSNVITVGLSYLSYKIRKRVGRTVFRELSGNGKSEGDNLI